MAGQREGLAGEWEELFFLYVTHCITFLYIFKYSKGLPSYGLYKNSLRNLYNGFFPKY